VCVGSGLAKGSSPVQGVLPAVYRIKKLKKVAEAQPRAIEPQIELLRLRTAQRMTVRRDEPDESERIMKEAVVIILKYYPGIYIDVLGKTSADKYF
jgi:hypothetical protein